MFKDLPARPATELDELIEMAANASGVLEGLRDQMLDPYPRKQAPEFTSHQVASLCGFDRTTLKNKEALTKTVRGRVKEGSNQKIYTLEEAIASVIDFSGNQLRPEGAQAKVIGICSYKGGVGKTTSAVSIAQGLTLKGHKVLLVDMDGQGSATTLFGISPELEIGFSDTVASEINAENPDFLKLVRPTYWHNLDLIPASASVLFAEFYIPMLVSQAREKDELFNMYGCVHNGLNAAKEVYDVIVFDTSPSLNYLTQNAIFASDMIFSPCPQKSLDLASLSQFWSIFSELSASAKYPDGDDISAPARAARDFMLTKKYDLVEVFMSMTKSDKDELGQTVKGWLKQSYKEHFWDIGIPESTIPEIQSAQLKTVFDMTGKECNTQAYKRYKEPLDALITHINHELHLAWKRNESSVPIDRLGLMGV